MFVPFQRLGDTDNTTGVGLGLALSLGLTEAMGGTLTAEDTPGGGLTMTVSVPVVSDVDYQCEPGQREREASGAGETATGGNGR
jgi:two-component system sensor histidine kinase KdpD